ncbi:ABC transporter permease YtrF precursor [Eubacteriaceae bacterium CHKCI004]|nr:ABC transporter permease YtrF precursor [Eubacteriaceae bacterium CHKCI004]
MWNSFSFRYIKENRTASLLLAGAALLSSLLLSLMTTLAYNLWMDYVKQQAAKGVTEIRPTTLFIVYGVVLALICAALIAMIHNAFAVSMGSRLQHLGILKSVGATPRQIRTFLVQEATALCVLPILLGTAIGVGICYMFVEQTIGLGQSLGLDVDYNVSFEYHILVAVISLAAAFLTAVLSAWIPARKISRLSPMEAIFGGVEPQAEKMRSFRLLSKTFGVYGELARKSIYNRRKSMRAATFVLFLSFIGFFIFLSAETISGLSTQETYYEKYHDVWDLMLTREAGPENEQSADAAQVGNAQTTQSASADSLLETLRAVPGVSRCISYQVIDTTLFLPEDMLSEELKQIGVETMLPEAERANVAGQEGWRTAVHLFVLDGQSFAGYCEDHNISSDAGAVAVNLLWDDRESDYMNRKYLPFVADDSGELYPGENASEPVLYYDACTNEIPAIREELEQKALNLVLSENAFRPLAALLSEAGTFSGAETNYNIYLEEAIREKEAESEAVREAIAALTPDEGYTLEGRIQEEASDQAARKGLRIVMGVLAALLACVGIAGILSATLGQIYQRKKEFARYLSVGVSPKDMQKLLFLEGLFIIGRPFLIAVIIDVPVTALLLQMSPPTAGQFISHLPLVPVLIFLCISAGAVSLAYLAAARSICQGDLVEILKDETMV